MLQLLSSPVLTCADELVFEAVLEVEACLCVTVGWCGGSRWMVPDLMCQ